MTLMENAVRELLDALLLHEPGLQKYDGDIGVDENVGRTGVAERFVKAYGLGLRAIGEP